MRRILKSFTKIFIVLLPIWLLLGWAQRERLTKSAPRSQNFLVEDNTSASGLHYVHTMQTLETFIPSELKHITPWMAATGINIAVTDYDRDGASDIFVSSSEVRQKHHLFRNQGQGNFINIGDKVFPNSVNQNHISFRPVFFDCDNDGFQDLAVTTSDCPRLFHNDGGKGYSDISASAGLDFCSGQNPTANAVDVNKDGRLDLVLASYKVYGANDLADSFFSASSDKQEAAIFKNEGSCHFTRLKNTGIQNTGHTHAIGVLDLRGMNRQDLWFVTDYGPDRLFLDNGDSTYQDASRLLEHSFSRNGMAFDVAYLDGLNPFIFVSHVFEPSYVISGNALWQWDGAEIHNRAHALGVERCGHAWGGKFADLNNDGLEDLVVTNGFRSANPNKKYSFPLASLSSTHKKYLQNAKHWPAFKDASLYGYEKNCVFVNTGKEFVEDLRPTPLHQDELDGRGIASLDIKGDGNLSLLIGNQKQALRLFTTTQQNRNKWIGFKLEGSCSNRDALGSKISIKTANHEFRKYYYPTNGYAAQSESAAHFGVGEEKVEEVTIEWPSGYKTKLAALGTGQYYKIKEDKRCAEKR